MKYSSEYAGVLENISKITFIKTNSTQAAKTIMNLCSIGGSISESGYTEMTEEMLTYLDDIEKNIGTDLFFARPFCRKLQNIFVGCCTYIL